jgi:hypothetical protein
MVRADIFQFLHLFPRSVVHRSLSHQYMVIKGFYQDREYTSWLLDYVPKRECWRLQAHRTEAITCR